jgi:hypothetical protein
VSHLPEHAEYRSQRERETYHVDSLPLRLSGTVSTVTHRPTPPQHMFKGCVKRKRAADEIGLMIELRGLSPRANYTDRKAAAFWRSQCQILLTEGVTWEAQRIPTAVFSVSRPEPLLFLSSASLIVPTRLSGPWSRPTTSQKIW